MSTLLVLRERLRKLYAEYTVYIVKLLQFVMGLLLFWMINSNIGFMETASSVFCTAGLAVICTFLPVNVMAIAAAGLILVQFYALSMPIAIVSFVIFLIMYIFYFRFAPKKAWFIILAGLAFGLRIPFVVPIAFGLMGTSVWIVPAACGIIAYYMVHFVKISATALKNTDAAGMAEGLMSFTRQVLANKEMWMMVMIVLIGILVVNTIRNRAVDHAWKIASAAGAVVCVVAAAAGNIVLEVNVSYTVLAVSALLGLAVGFILEFLFFSVDYSRTENMQFEDDEYYYYVKAVPKIGVPVPEKKVTHITEHQTQETVVMDSGAQAQLAQQAGEGKEEQAQNAAADLEAGRTADEILLTRSLSKELGLDQERDSKRE